MANGEGPWGDFWKKYGLEQEPEAAYYSAKPFGAGYTYAERPMARAANPWGASEFDDKGEQVQGGFSPYEQQHWASQYGNVKNQYLGELGRRMRAGMGPDMTFSDFLEDYPWTQRFTALPPSMTSGSGSTRFAPSTRYMY